ncbi:hypothetical protein DAVIS_00393 [Mycobacterium marinum]|uniref:Uncharacterized protein n=1 Tax=Mycobacterium marinum TaxID=1781 RepID=A0A3E2N2U4_MYCMR|nr:hypothetical protein DAVIS_00393 [Mycobacterium marinum]
MLTLPGRGKAPRIDLGALRQFRASEAALAV